MANGDKILEQLETRQVVELLLTWGAAAQPDLADLLDVLASFGRADPRTLVRTILETPGLALPAELQLEFARMADPDQGDPQALADALPRLAGAVASSVAAQRNTVRDEFGAWASLLQAEELDGVLAKIWSHEAAVELADYAAAGRELEEARGLLGKARWRIESELRDKIENEDGNVDAALAARVRQATGSRRTPGDRRGVERTPGAWGRSRRVRRRRPTRSSTRAACESVRPSPPGRRGSGGRTRRRRDRPAPGGPRTPRSPARARER